MPILVLGLVAKFWPVLCFKAFILFYFNVLIFIYFLLHLKFHHDVYLNSMTYLNTFLYVLIHLQTGNYAFPPHARSI